MALEDSEAAVKELTTDELWLKPGGAASVGFHLAHLSGSTDRLLTYAQGKPLTADQLRISRAEHDLEATRPSLESLLMAWHSTVTRALKQIADTPEADLLLPREVGRAKFPSTVIGLIFHAAEHAQRHTGQLVTTAKIVRGSRV